MNNNSLKSCPNCHSTAHVIAYGWDGEHYAYYVACENCNVHTVGHIFREAAVQDWNTNAVYNSVA